MYISLSVPVDAMQINFVFHDDSGYWDINSGNNWNASVNANDLLLPDLSAPVMSFPYVPVQGQQIKIIYNGVLAAGASSITMQWGYNGWVGVTDVIMTRQSDGSWIGNAFLPQVANSLNMSFFNQSGTWDNNSGSNYKLPVWQR